jgi:predicted HD superfamily hydrolase involved in NAD metabolism
MSTSETIRSTGRIIESLLPGAVKPGRYAHILRVTEMMESLADRFGLDAEKARLIGLSHDFDRDAPSWKALALVSDWNISVTALERTNPVMLHGPVTAARLYRHFRIRDLSVVSAVRHHTLGSPDLDLLGLSLYVADTCEPGRSFPDEEQREMIMEQSSLPAMVREIISMNIRRFGPLEEPTMQLYARVTGE